MTHCGIKICGITQEEHVKAAVHLGVDAVGFMFYEPSVRYIDAIAAQALSRFVSPFMSLVGVFANPSAEYVCSVLERVPLNILQFHGSETVDFCRQFNRPYLKAIALKTANDALEACRVYSDASAILLDTPSEKLGGTGTVFNWSRIPAEYHQKCSFVLSGGLNAHNIQEAIKTCSPHAVDVSSGVECAVGQKDVKLMAHFVKNVRNL